MMVAMIDIPTIDKRLEQKLERRLNFTQWILILLLIIVIAVPVVASWWIARQTPFISTVSVDNVQLVGESALCPGEPLLVSYDFHAKGAGVLVRDRTLWQTTPPKTIIFSASRRFILTGPIDQHLTEAWHVPPTYRNPETDIYEPIPPGDYALLMAISSPSRSTVVAISSVSFSIRSDCN
jgi:hypothetical protein